MCRTCLEHLYIGTYIYIYIYMDMKCVVGIDTEYNAACLSVRAQQHSDIDIGEHPEALASQPNHSL